MTKSIEESAGCCLLPPPYNTILPGILYTKGVGFAVVKGREEREKGGNDELMEWNNVATSFCYRQETIRRMNGTSWYLLLSCGSIACFVSDGMERLQLERHVGDHVDVLWGLVGVWGE